MKTGILGVFLLALSSNAIVASAQEVKRAKTSETEDSRYTYIQAHYVPLEQLGSDGEDIDGNGFGFDASYHFSQRVYAFGRADFADLDGDVLGTNVSSDVELYSAGLGFRRGVPSFDGKLDIYSEFSYEGFELDDINAGGNDLGSTGGDGFGIAAGVRWIPFTNLEINPAVGYVDYGDGANGGRFGMRAIYEVGGIFALTAGIQRTEFGDDTDLTTIRLGIRAYLGGDILPSSTGGFTR